MNTFNLDKNYQQFNFEEISVDQLQIISGGSGGDLGDSISETARDFAGLSFAGYLARGAMTGGRIGMWGGLGAAVGGAVIGGIIGAGAYAAGEYLG